MKGRIGKRASEGGQTLLIGVVCLVVIVFCAFFLIDLTGMIRAKIKTVTAVDAAAQIGANWQRYSLNMIGDLNLLKASDILLGDVGSTAGMTLPEQADAFAEMNTLYAQVQSRVSFAGPLIGFYAAQQGAIANGVPLNPGFKRVVEEHKDKIASYAYSDEFVPQYIVGFPWREPYYAMLEPDALAVAVNTNYLWKPRIDANAPSFLMDKRIYDYILMDYWCGLRHILRGNYDGAWWSDMDIELTMKSGCSVPIRGSEYFPINVHPASTDVYRAAYDIGALDDYTRRRGLTPILDYEQDYRDPPHGTDPYYDPLRRLIFFRFCHVYWTSYSENKRETWNSFFRSDLQPGYAYNGAIAQCWAEIEPPLTQIQNRNAVPLLEISASAKPLGQLLDGSVPFAAAYFIFPCFDRTALMPVEMEKSETPDPFDYKWFAFITEYLPALAEVANIEDMNEDIVPYPEHWPWFVRYHEALLKFDDPAWRQEGIDWLDTRVRGGTNESVYCEGNRRTGTTGTGTIPGGTGPVILH